jgi:hypothetical protein
VFAWLGSHVERKEAYISAYQCRAGTERRLGIHGRVGCSTSAYFPGPGPGRVCFDEGELFSCSGWAVVLVVVVHIIADKEFARPGRSRSLSSIKVLYLADVAPDSGPTGREDSAVNLRVGSEVRCRNGDAVFVETCLADERRFWQILDCQPHAGSFGDG